MTSVVPSLPVTGLDDALIEEHGSNMAIAVITVVNTS